MRGHLEGLTQAVRTVFSALFGIRRRNDHDTDTHELHPAYLVAAVLVGAVLFISALLMIVRAVTAH